MLSLVSQTQESLPVSCCWYVIFCFGAVSARTPRTGTREAVTQTPESASARRQQQDRDATPAAGLGSQEAGPPSAPAEARPRSRPAAPSRPPPPVVVSTGPSSERQPTRELSFLDSTTDMLENDIFRYGVHTRPPPPPKKKEGGMAGHPYCSLLLFVWL